MGHDLRIEQVNIQAVILSMRGSFMLKFREKLHVSFFIAVDGAGCPVIAAQGFTSRQDEDCFSRLLHDLANAKQGAPVVIFTDGDAAMKKAIENIFPLCTHLLCLWHLLQNFIKNMSKKLRGTHLHLRECVGMFLSATKATSQKDFNVKWQELKAACVDIEEAHNYINYLESFKEKFANYRRLTLPTRGLASTQMVESSFSSFKRRVGPKAKWESINDFYICVKDHVAEQVCFDF